MFLLDNSWIFKSFCKIDEANCHPFLFNDGKLALIHNGVISIRCSIEGLSDTAHFVKLVLEPLVRTFKVPINNGSLNYLLCTSIGSDKLAIMDGDGRTYIFNEDKGTWDEGVWYSNTSFRWPSKTTYGSSSSYVSGTTYGSSRTAGFHTGSNESWRKNWEAENDEDDETYLEFWRRSTASDTKPAPRLLNAPKNDGVDDAGNVIIAEETGENETGFKEGQMCEYGWFDLEIEAAIKNYQETLCLTREEAMVRVFNERG